MKSVAVAASDAEPEWMRGFGTLSQLHRETALVKVAPLVKTNFSLGLS